VSSATLPVQGAPTAPPYPNGAPDRGLIQFTSGSTGLPKPIVISHEQILFNANKTAERVEFDCTSIYVSWLPLHHDMGFILALMMPLASQARLVLIPTETFLRNPTVWLTTISEARGTHTGGPSFACRLLSNAAYARRIANVDLSSLRYCGLGAERVSWATVREFEDTYASHGLRPGAVRAGFGMAEATLMVTCTVPFGTRRIAWIARGARAAGRPRAQASFHRAAWAACAPARP